MHGQTFTMKEAIFKAGVILIVCRVWAKQGVAICLFDMGGVGFELLINSLILRPMTKMRSSSTHISNFNVWRFFEDGKKADSVQHQII